MPRRPRVDMVGYYHIVNRGVEQRIVYKVKDDYTMFLELLCSGCQLYDVQLHGYVLMSNHYHLLIETRKENLSKFMKHLNASYAIYFNKKYKRSGHLWQGRFKSWYVTDEAYLYTLISYIENNPVKAKMVKALGKYEYSSYLSFVEQREPIGCLKCSFVFEKFTDRKDRVEFFECGVDERILEEIQKASTLVVTSIKEKKLDSKSLKHRFQQVKDQADRDHKILKAYEAGYSQHAIAECLELSQPQINRVIKKVRGIGIT
ncbi:transposase [Sulfurimonas sp. HSL3-7]|uniref:transposase n=1 Tax=Sulfonitrofixus jiaomeiensis TaxID=3131938 RepID=UPI0031F933DC